MTGVILLQFQVHFYSSKNKSKGMVEYKGMVRVIAPASHSELWKVAAITGNK